MTSPATLSTQMREIQQLGLWCAESTHGNDPTVSGAVAALQRADSALGRGKYGEANKQLAEAADFFNFSCGTGQAHQPYVQAALQRIAALRTQLRQHPSTSQTPPPLPDDLAQQPEHAWRQIRRQYPELTWMNDRPVAERFALVHTMGAQAPRDLGRSLCVVEVGAGQLLQLALTAHELVRRGHRQVRLVAIDHGTDNRAAKAALDRFLEQLSQASGATVQADAYQTVTAYRHDVAAGSAPAPDMTLMVLSDGGHTYPGNLEADRLEVRYRDGISLKVNLPVARPVSVNDIAIDHGFGTRVEDAQQRARLVADLAQDAYALHHRTIARLPPRRRRGPDHNENWRFGLSNRLRAVLTSGAPGPDHAISMTWYANPVQAARQLSDLNSACQHFSG